MSRLTQRWQDSRGVPLPEVEFHKRLRLDAMLAELYGGSAAVRPSDDPFLPRLGPEDDDGDEGQDGQKKSNTHKWLEIGPDTCPDESADPIPPPDDSANRRRAAEDASEAATGVRRISETDAT